MSYEILVDSGSNLTADVLNKYNIKLISFRYREGDEEYICYEPSMDFAKVAHEYYDKMRAGVEFKTSLINSDQFENAMREILSKGDDLIYLGISSGISGTVQASKIAADNLREEFPNRKIYIIDTLAASLGQGLQAVEASILREQGLSVDETYKQLTDRIMYMNQYFTVDDLKYLTRSGRLSSGEAFLGNLLSIKPILKGNDEGQIVLQQKVRSRKKSLDTLIDYCKEHVTDPADKIFAIAHCDVPEDVEYIIDRVQKEIGFRDVIKEYYDLCTGSHVGPGTIAIFFYGKRKE
ncbi:MAG: DegV family protein [Lachnospiraceae bacterium]|nr:DegV family protein [Lachnospiraceae bacterium]